MNQEYFKALLHTRDLKATTPRLNLLMKMEQYQSAMPYSAIQKAMQSSDRVTIYRTLEKLIEQGVIHKAFQDNNEVYYAICGNQCGSSHHHHDHIHFKCSKCKSVSCVDLNYELKIDIPDYEVHNVTIHANGICKSCMV